MSRYLSWLTIAVAAAVLVADTVYARRIAADIAYDTAR
jgi:hypothetical protein